MIMEGRISVEGNIDIQIYESFDQVSKLQKEWDKFMESMGGEVFLTYDWCCIWWKYYGKKRDLRIFIFRCNGAILGVLPMFVEKIWVGPIYAKVMKIIGTDFTLTTASLPILKESMVEVIKLFLREVKMRGGCDIIHFGPISGRYEFFEDFIGACDHSKGKSWHIRTKNNDVQTYFKIADNWDDQIASLSHEQRRAMRRKYERILKEGRLIECIQASQDNFYQLFDGFVQMHQAHWQNQGKAGHFGAWPSSYEFHRDVAAIQLKHERLRLYEIKLDGSVIGYNYGYKFGDTYYYLLFGRGSFENESKTDFVRIDFGEMIKRAVKENVKWFDTMRGRYEYKLHLGGELFPIKNVYLISNNLFTRMRVTAFRLLAKGIDLCYSKIWRSRIVPRIRIKVGPFWGTWIKSCQLSD
ncbi:MAG: GNAT family N-acetyltransferase [Candidatus Omnitrophica bacterium]|nr:GNAT family N-acetyltransferase [Candidatus Omnitrophota bacterium]